jgi:hydrogenase-4 component B
MAAALAFLALGAFLAWWPRPTAMRLLSLGAVSAFWGLLAFSYALGVRWTLVWHLGIMPWLTLRWQPNPLSAVGGAMLAILGLGVLLHHASSPGKKSRPRSRRDTRGLAAWGLLAAGSVLLSQSLFTLFLSWEAMAGLGGLLLAWPWPSSRSRRGTAMYWLFSQAGSAFLWAGLLLELSGSDAWRWLAGPMCVVGMGSKAALFPFYAWMPVAEPETAGWAAGLLSGGWAAVAVLAMANLPRLLPMHLVPDGWLVVLLGLGSALAGALGALTERDTTRALAYMSAETLGLSLVALGVGWVDQGLGLAGVAALGETGALALALTHSGAKWVLFTVSEHLRRQGLPRQLDRLGGLLRSMPALGAQALLAAASLAGFPPLGGFLGEWLTLEGLFAPLPPRQVAVHVLMVLAGALVAFVASVALTSYLRWAGMVFLGPVRGKVQVATSDAPLGSLAGLAVALLLPVGTGLGSPWLLPAWQRWLTGGPPLLPPLFLHPAMNPTLVRLGAAVGKGLPGAQGVVLAPNQGMSVLSPWDLAWVGMAVVGLTYLLVRLLSPGARGKVRRVEAWAGGEPTFQPSFTYTAEGLVQPLRLSLASWLGLSRRWAHRIPGRVGRRYAVTSRPPAEEALRQGWQWARRAGQGLGHLLEGWNLSRDAAYILVATVAVVLLTGLLVR